jgi:hypothetical protein
MEFLVEDLGEEVSTRKDILDLEFIPSEVEGSAGQH